MPADDITQRPAPRLVRTCVVLAVVALAAVPYPAMLDPAIALITIVTLVATIDWRLSSNDPPPQAGRIMPERLIVSRPAKLEYCFLRPDGPRTVVSLLDELPAELGGDLLIRDVILSSGVREERSRELIPLRRGTCLLGPALVLWSSRLGLFRFRARVATPGTVEVFPASIRSEQAALTERSIRTMPGLRPRQARGESKEFDTLREYVPGDDPRDIDWRATARRGRLSVRQYRTERRQTVMIAIDSGRLMAGSVDGNSKLEHALNCSLVLAYASQRFGDRVGLLGFDRELRVLVKPSSGLAVLTRIIDATLNLDARPYEPDYHVLVEAMERHQRKRALLVVLTDFVEGAASAELERQLAVLAKRHRVLLVALRDRMLAEIDRRQPEITRAGLFRRLAIQDLAVEREAALRRISRMGAQTLDLDPARIASPVLNRYLSMRHDAPL